MSARHLSARTIRRALDVLLALPAEALGDLAERLIDQLDAAGADPDREEETDACEAGECGGVPFRLDHHPGNPDDAEPSLGYPEGFCHAVPGHTADPDLEMDRADEEPGVDDESDHDAEPAFPAFHHGPDVLGARCWTGAPL